MDSRDTLLDEDVRRCSDEQLVAGLRQTLRKQRGMTARLVAFIAEVDARRLYRDHAHTSMFSYAVREFQMSMRRLRKEHIATPRGTTGTGRACTRRGIDEAVGRAARGRGVPPRPTAASAGSE